LHQEWWEVHIYASLYGREGQWPFAEKNSLPMKKSNVRFFHGEAVFFSKRAALAGSA
jgi:hypothetical protein